MERTADAPSGDGGTDLDDGTIDRRSYLKWASAAAVVGAGAASATGGAIASEEYELIEASGQKIRLDDGETFENKLIDVTTGERFRIIALGTDWTIRNVGFIGYNQGAGFRIAIADTGRGTSVVENVYLGDGSAKVGDFVHGPGAIWVSPDHNGHIDFRRCNIQGWPNNGIYGSAPGDNSGGGDGTLHIDRCYAANNGVASFRTGAEGDRITNSSILLDGNGYNGRAIWAKDGETTIQNVHARTNDRHYSLRVGSGARARLEDFHYDGGLNTPDTDGIYASDGSAGLEMGNTTNDPNPFVPDGCPTSAEEAASGGRSIEGEPSEPGDSEDGQNEQEGEQASENLFFINPDLAEESDQTDYTFTADGRIDPVTEYQATINPATEVAENDDGTWSASAAVINERDAFRFDGELLEVTREGDAPIFVNLEEIDPADYGDEPQDSLERTLLVDGVGTDGVSNYEFTVTGKVERSTLQGASIDDSDVVDGGHVEGSIAGWRDAYRFSGDVEDLFVDGGADVLVDGERIDPSTYGDALPKELTFVGTGVPTSFEVTVDGEIEAATDATVEASSIVSGSSVECTVERDVRRFRFGGAVTDITFVEGNATVYIGQERIDPDDYNGDPMPPHALVIDGTDTSEPSTYSFTIDGTVVKSEYMDASIDDNDTLEGTTVRGGVANWIDAYWFDGDITKFKLLGEANVNVEYNARNR